MERVFISQPMKGLSNEEIESKRAEAVKNIKAILGNDVEIIDSFFKDAPHDAKPLWYLAESIHLLATADFAYFVEGWQNARGCIIEYMCAGTYGINIISECGMNIIKD